MSALKTGTSEEETGGCELLAPRSADADADDRARDAPDARAAHNRAVIDRRVASVCIAGALFAGVFVLRELSTSTGDAFSFLYVIPVAIIALEMGLLAGLAAAAGATVLVAIWLVTRQLPFNAAPLAVRGAVLFSVVLIAGWFSDQMRASSAAIASENVRLGALEHDQAALQAEVERMRNRLDKQLRNALRVVEGQEQERRGIARQLHEEAAQTMAAALLTVGLIERGAERELTRAQLEDVRSQVRSSIADLRRIATSLRPAVLDEMGLETALLRIAEVEAERNSRTVTFSTQGLSPDLPPDAEAVTYRVVEEVLAALEQADRVSVRLSTPQEAIQVVVEARLGRSLNLAAAAGGEALGEDSLHAALAETRARVELIGGSLQVAPLLDQGSRIVAELPLAG